MKQAFFQKTPKELADKWSTRSQSASKDYSDGVNNYAGRAPGTLASEAYDRWLANVTSAGPKWKANVSKVTTLSWQTAVEAYGATAYRFGVTNKKLKYEAGVAKLQAWLKAIDGQIKLEPNADINGRLEYARKIALALHEKSLEAK